MLASELGAGGGLRIVPGENVARAKVELGLGDANSLAADTLARVRTLLGKRCRGPGLLRDPGEPGRPQDPPRRPPAGHPGRRDHHRGRDRPRGGAVRPRVARAGRRLRRGAGSRGETGQGAGARAASSPEAARLYSEGINRLRLFEPAAARELLERAVAADPRNALAHSGLASALATLGYDRRAREEAKAAFDLSASLPPEDRLLIEGRYRETTQDWRRAVQIYWDLWSMFPDNLDHGLRLAAAQTAAGQVEEALATTDALRTLPPPVQRGPAHRPRRGHGGRSPRRLPAPAGRGRPRSSKGLGAESDPDGRAGPPHGMPRPAQPGPGRAGPRGLRRGPAPLCRQGRPGRRGRGPHPCGQRALRPGRARRSLAASTKRPWPPTAPSATAAPRPER